MKRFIEGEDRRQVTMLPECLDDYIGEDNPVRVVDVFVEELDLLGLGFAGAETASTGRPAYHPAVLLKLYIYGYLNRIRLACLCVDKSHINNIEFNRLSTEKSITDWESSSLKTEPVKPSPSLAQDQSRSARHPACALSNHPFPHSHGRLSRPAARRVAPQPASSASRPECRATWGAALPSFVTTPLPGCQKAALCTAAFSIPGASPTRAVRW